MRNCLNYALFPVVLLHQSSFETTRLFYVDFNAFADRAGTNGRKHLDIWS